MRIDLRMVKRLKGNIAGRTLIPSKNRAVIEISKERSTDLALFGEILFHELLHVWTNMMHTNGARIDMRKEHRFIYAMHKPLTQKLQLMRRKS